MMPSMHRVCSGSRRAHRPGLMEKVLLHLVIMAPITLICWEMPKVGSGSRIAGGSREFSRSHRWSGVWFKLSGAPDFLPLLMIGVCVGSPRLSSQFSLPCVLRPGEHCSVFLYGQTVGEGSRSLRVSVDCWRYNPHRIHSYPARVSRSPGL